MNNIKVINIILPVFNESEVIRSFYEELKYQTNKITQYQFEILFVLDKSNDNTENILHEIAREDESVTILVLSKRFGHQLSLVAGINHSDGDAAIMMDSDLQHPPALIGQLLNKFEEGFDIVHTIRRDNNSIGFFKKTTSKLFYRFINRISPVKVSQGAADFRLISRPVINVFKLQIKEQNQFLRGLFHWVGFNQTFIEFKADDRHAGKSKYGLFKLVSFAIDGITSFSRAPLRMSIYFGLLISFASMLYGVFAFISFFVDNTIPPGWASLAIIVSFVGGVQLIFLGIIGEYIGKIFDEVKGRPLFIVQRLIRFKKR